MGNEGNNPQALAAKMLLTTLTAFDATRPTDWDRLPEHIREQIGTRSDFEALLDWVGTQNEPPARRAVRGAKALIDGAKDAHPVLSGEIFEDVNSWLQRWDSAHDAFEITGIDPTVAVANTVELMARAGSAIETLRRDVSLRQSQNGGVLVEGNPLADAPFSFDVSIQIVTDHLSVIRNWAEAQLGYDVDSASYEEAQNRAVQAEAMIVQLQSIKQALMIIIGKAVDERRHAESEVESLRPDLVGQTVAPWSGSDDDEEDDYDEDEEEEDDDTFDDIDDDEEEDEEEGVTSGGPVFFFGQRR